MLGEHRAISRMTIFWGEKALPCTPRSFGSLHLIRSGRVERSRGRSRERIAEDAVEYQRINAVSFKVEKRPTHTPKNLPT